jgi:hypothetical protein
MHHPFALNLSDLEVIEQDFVESLSNEEATQVQGGGEVFTTLALGEEGGDVTTLALGEEGGSIQCISAPCPGSETGGNPYPIPIPPKPPVVTCMKGEDGGGSFYTKAWFGIEGGGWSFNW